MHEHEYGKRLSDATEQATDWDARYRDRDGALWSGRPNGRLVSDVAGLTPGRALDVGCGEGARAIWRAERGWTVTGLGVAEAAVWCAPEASHRRGDAVERRGG